MRRISAFACSIFATSSTRFAASFGFILAVLLFPASVLGQAQQTKFALKSTVLGEERTILVRTPAAYDSNQLRYPVLYLTDGDAHLNHTASSVEFLARNGRMTEMIVVGITNTDRTRDLTPTRVRIASNGASYPTSGGADNFLKFIESELIPEIEKRYRVQPYRVLAGHSLGGLFAVHTMVSRPEIFHSYIAVSPALQWDDELLLKRSTDFFKDRKDWNATLVVTLGNEQGLIGESFANFKRLLNDTKISGFEWHAEQLADEDHGTVVLRSHYLGLRQIFNGWQVPRDPETGGYAVDLKGAEEHYNRLSKRFNFAIPPPENLINQLGYQALFSGKDAEAIAIFKSNIERYPNSANVYDSLAEAYERGDRLDLAAPLYEKAQTIGEQIKDPNLAIYKANFERASKKLKQAEAAKKNH